MVTALTGESMRVSQFPRLYRVVWLRGFNAAFAGDGANPQARHSVRVVWWHGFLAGCSVISINKRKRVLQ